MTASLTAADCLPASALGSERAEYSCTSAQGEKCFMSESPKTPQKVTRFVAGCFFEKGLKEESAKYGNRVAKFAKVMDGVESHDYM